MTSPRPYGGGYSSPSFPDTPIYDRLVAERGTPQIAPIRVPAAYEPAGYQHPAPQPALPALPALPAAPSHPQPHPQPHFQHHPAQAGGHPGYPAAPVRHQLPAAASHGPATAYVPQQAAPRPYPAPGPGSTPAPGTPVPQMPVPQHMRPAAPRPAPPRPMPGAYGNLGPAQQGYAANQPNPPQQHPYPNPGYWSESGSGH